MQFIAYTVNQQLKQPAHCGGVHPCACLRVERLFTDAGMYGRNIAKVQINSYEGDLGMT